MWGYIYLSYFSLNRCRESGLTGFVHGPRAPVSGCAYGSTTLLLYSHIDSFHPSGCSMHTIFTLSSFASPTVSAKQHHEHVQAWFIADLADFYKTWPVPLPASNGTPHQPTKFTRLRSSTTLAQLVHPSESLQPAGMM